MDYLSRIDKYKNYMEKLHDQKIKKIKANMNNQNSINKMTNDLYKLRVSLNIKHKSNNEEVSLKENIFTFILITSVVLIATSLFMLITKTPASLLISLIILIIANGSYYIKLKNINKSHNPKTIKNEIDLYKYNSERSKLNKELLKLKRLKIVLEKDIIQIEEKIKLIYSNSLDYISDRKELINNIAKKEDNKINFNSLTSELSNHYIRLTE